MRDLAIVAAIKAFVKQAKENHLAYCKSVVEKAEAEKLEVVEVKEDK